MRPEDASRLSESLTNEEFIGIYRNLDQIQNKLSHEEFHFVRYLLKMVLIELDEHAKPGTSGSQPQTDDPVALC